MMIGPTGRGMSVGLIALCQVLAMALWFSASAVVPQLRSEQGLDSLRASLFTSAVQGGFVLGTLVSALLVLADRVDPRRLFIASALLASLANAAILALDPGSVLVIALRLLTGMCMAGIYPVGMKLVTTWARDDLGFLVGLLVGALTLGSASPHLFAAWGISQGHIDWRFTLGAASVSAVAAAVLMTRVRIGPRIGPSAPFDLRLAFRGWSHPPLRLANLGYLGHMWEIYAMWAWIGVFLSESFAGPLGDDAPWWGAVATFGVVGSGAIGCVAGGRLADRWGRTTVTMAAMGASGACALGIGFLFGGSPAVLVAVAIVWGVTIVMDSAQFSASVAELSPTDLVGTMLTAQTCLGFLLTLGSIHLMPHLVTLVGWRYAFAFLAIGPVVGVIAMGRLRAHPDARRLAGGRG